MSDLPIGTVTFLFTDIESSTHLLQQLGYQYVTVLTESRRLMRTAFQQFHGYEVDTQGDSFFVAFPCACDAVSAAVLAQRLLFAYSWPQDVMVRIRMGIHTGEPLLLAEGYIGLDVHCAARIMSAGHGGQVLISQATHDLVANNLPVDQAQPPTVHALAWSPNRRSIASGGHDRLVRVWKSTTGLTSCLYRGHTSSVTRVVWSPDGQYIASASLNEAVHVWQTMPVEGKTTEQKVSSYDGYVGVISSMIWSPNGACIVSSCTGGTETSVRVWEAMTGRVLLTYRGHAYWVRALAWSPNGKLLASGALKEVQVWEASSGHKVFTFHRHEGWVKAVAWSPDGTRLASTGEDKLVQVWKLGRDHSLLTYRGHTDWVGIVEWSPDSKHIASISKDHVLKIWNATTGNDILTFRYNDNAMHAIAWLPDGKHLVSVNDRGVVQIWQAQDTRVPLN